MCASAALGASLDICQPLAGVQLLLFGNQSFGEELVIDGDPLGGEAGLLLQILNLPQGVGAFPVIGNHLQLGALAADCERSVAGAPRLLQFLAGCPNPSGRAPAGSLEPPPGRRRAGHRASS